MTMGVRRLTRWTWARLAAIAITGRWDNDVIDHSLDKLIALERAAAQRELADLQERLQAFEARYQMPSEEPYRRFRAGELGDAMDVVEWSIFYEMWYLYEHALSDLRLTWRKGVEHVTLPLHLPDREKMTPHYRRMPE